MVAVRLAQRLFATLTLLAMLVGAFSRVTTAWACEGRVCSSDAARCCCASPSPARDDTCLTSSVGSAGACPGECGCTAVLVKAPLAGASKVAQAAFPALAAPAALPEAAFLFQAYVALETPQVRPLPPPDRRSEPPCVEHASLRAPPVAA